MSSEPPSKQSHILSKRDLLLLIACAALLILLSYFLDHPNDVHMLEMLSHLSRDTGIALAVGFIVILAIEVRHREDLRKELDSYIEKLETNFNDYRDSVSRNFLYAVFARNHNKKLLDTVTNTIFSRSVVRENTRIDVKLHSLNSEREAIGVPSNIRPNLTGLIKTLENNCAHRLEYLVLMTLRLDFKVHNISDEIANYIPIVMLPIPFGSDYENLCGVFSFKIGGVEYVSGLTSSNKSESEIVYKMDKNFDVPKGDLLRVEIEMYSIRWKDDKESFAFIHPTNGFSISVYDGDGDKHITLTPNFIGKELDNPDVSTIVKAKETNTARLETDEFLLPCQGVVVNWRPIRPVGWCEQEHNSNQGELGRGEQRTPTFPNQQA